MATASKKTVTATKTETGTTVKKPVAKKVVAEAKTATKKATVTVVKKAAAKAPVLKEIVKKVATPKATVTKAAAPKAAVAEPKPAKAPAVKKTTTKIKTASVTPEQRYHMISTAAYFLAERRGFSGSYEMQDWISAEFEIEAKLNP